MDKEQRSEVRVFKGMLLILGILMIAAAMIALFFLTTSGPVNSEDSGEISGLIALMIFFGFLFLQMSSNLSRRLRKLNKLDRDEKTPS